MDSNVVMWFSPHHNITEGVPQSRNAVRRYTTEVTAQKVRIRQLTNNLRRAIARIFLFALSASLHAKIKCKQKNTSLNE